MPIFRLSPDFEMHYVIDDFTAPWRAPGTINDSDITDDMPKIKCPMLVITTQGSGLASVEQTRAWQQQVPNSELVVLPGDSFHVAVTDPERCAQATLEFIARNSKPTD